MIHIQSSLGAAVIMKRDGILHHYEQHMRKFYLLPFSFYKKCDIINSSASRNLGVPKTPIIAYNIISKESYEGGTLQWN